MLKSRLEKAPGDDMLYEWDFKNEDAFAAPNPITVAVITDWDGNALSGIVVGAPAYNSPLVQTQISGGTASTTPYYIKCKASNARGDDREGFLELFVRLPKKDTA